MYVEQDCTIRHEGKEFTANGAVVTDDVLIGYKGKDGVLTDWHGKPLGTYRVLRSWPIWNSHFRSRAEQIEARVNGIVYTGRSCDQHDLFKGRRKR